MNLEGIGLGNGWMDAKVQGPVVIDYAWWHGMIDTTTRDALHAVWENCKAGVPMAPPYHDFTVPDECNIMGAVLAAAGQGAFPEGSFRSPNTYDVTTFDLYPMLYSLNSTYASFFNKPEVKEALHAPMDIKWLQCIPGAGRRLQEEQLPGALLLAHDKPESVVSYLAELLDEAGIRVIIYNGDRDMSTCAQGSEMVLDGMDWSGAEGWKTGQRALWMVDDQVAGFAKSYKGLEFVVVYNSGHLVPANVPVAALDLITRFVTDEPYGDIPLPSFKAPEAVSKKEMLVHESVYHVLFVPALAVVCFFSGFLAASYRYERKSYTRISDVVDGDVDLRT
jgi:carboxypeptidase C (cathepsin A)